MKIFGLTGSIATGKSFAAKFFITQDIKVFCADTEVARLLTLPEVIALIKNCKTLSPVVKEEKIDKKTLSQLVFSNLNNLHLLEDILHPLVQKQAEKFIATNQNEKFLVLEIPLFFEKNYQKYCHKVITTHCSSAAQKYRALNRLNLDAEKYNFILKQQMPISHKALLTDYIVYTDISDQYTNKQLEEILGS
jgi:dephospho-CoA kinase